MPFVLRSKDNGRYTMIGPAYIHGIMDGEIMEAERHGEYLREMFVIE
jgi:hypothetical protein